MESRSPKQIWQTALGELQIQVNKPNYQTWLEKTTGLEYHDTQFTVGVPSTFVAEYLDKNQRSLIEKVLTSVTKSKVKVQFQVEDQPYERSTRSESRRKPAGNKQFGLPLFNPRYTFDSFIVGNCNQLAYAVAMGVSQYPGRSYNPLYIYGGSGLGKTHLLQAIGHAALDQHINVIYVNAEQYTNELMNALRDKKTDDFRNKYRSVDMLLVDDVQFFCGKEQTGESFFHTFDELLNANRQIAVTSSCPPNSLTNLPDRLLSRFEGGLVTDLQAPDFETRLAILQNKTQQDGIEAPQDVLELIALQIKENIRLLEGSLNRVVAYSKLIRAVLTPEITARALKDIASFRDKPVPVTPALIKEAVANGFQLTLSDLKGRKRDEATALARQVAMYLIRQDTDCSLAETGRELGGRSPATVSHAYQKIAGAINDSPSLRRKLTDIRKTIYTFPRNGFE